MATCACLCHSARRGNQRACAQEGRFFEAFSWAQDATLHDEPVADADVLEAAVACDVCRGAHCAALSYPKKFVQWRPPTLTPQADGWVGEDGG